MSMQSTFSHISSILLGGIIAISGASPTVAQPLGDTPPADRNVAAIRFVEEHGGKILWDVRSGLPGRLSGTEARVAEALDESNAGEGFLQFLEREEALFAVPVDRLRLMSVQTRDDRVYLKFGLTFDGVPIEGLELGGVLRTDGVLLRYASNVLPDLPLSTDARLSRTDAERVARAALLIRGMQTAGPPTSNERAFVTKRRKDDEDSRGPYRLVYRVVLRVAESAGDPRQLVTVDAMTGEIVSVADANPWAIQGTVRGEIYPTAPTDPPVARDLDNLLVTGIKPAPYGVAAAVTADGDYVLPTWAGNWILVSGLNGPFASVDSVANAAVNHIGSVSDGATHSWTWRNTSGDDLDQVNVFYHLNLLHDNLYKAVLNYDWKNPWQKGSPVFRAETGIAGTNAFAGDPMTFSVNAARSADTIYHEASHNVIYGLFGAWVGFGKGAFREGYAFDEGFADFFAAEMLDDPQVNGRNLDNTMQYPNSYTPSTALGLEGHQGGQIIAGAAWNLRGLLRERFGAELGTRLNTALVFKALIEMAVSPSPYRFSMPGTANFLEAMLLADDNDTNVANGTPRDREIFQAFRNHRLLPVDLFVRDHNTDQGDVPSNPNGEPYWLSPDIIVQDSPLAKIASVKYKLPKFAKESWIRVRVRNDGYLASKSATVNVYVRGLYDPAYWPWTKLGSVTVTGVPANGSKLSPPITWKPKPLQVLRAEILSDEDIMTEAGKVPLENNLARRNLATFVAWPGATMTVDYPLKALTNEEIVKSLTKTGASSMSVDLWHEVVDENAAIEAEIVSLGGDPVDRTAPVQPHAVEQRWFVSPVAVTGTGIWSPDELDSPLMRGDDAEHFAGHANPRVEQVPVPYLVRSYEVARLSEETRTGPRLQITVAEDAQPGQVLHFHVGHQTEGTVLGGMTYEVVVAERTPAAEARLEAMLETAGGSR
jgi:hypothetical protein